MNAIKVKKLRPDARIPEYATEGAACFDLRSAIPFPTGIFPGERVTIWTGLAFEIPGGYEIQVRPRSGLSKQGIDVVLGTIDSDYRGEVKIILVNTTDKEFMVNPGDRIAQAKLSRVPFLPFQEVTELSETKRGQGGFGHTGVV